MIYGFLMDELIGNLHARYHDDVKEMITMQDYERVFSTHFCKQNDDRDKRICVMRYKYGLSFSKIGKMVNLTPTRIKCITAVMIHRLIQYLLWVSFERKKADEIFNNYRYFRYQF